MPNILFELDKLRVTLRNKGFDSGTVENIVTKAGQEINKAFEQQVNAAMELAIQSGVDKSSADFINELQYDGINMELTTQSGNMEFTEPPYPMLSKLLRNAKPMKDGSGVYKVIPVGSSSIAKPKVSTNIYDASKQINAERIENAKRQHNAIAPAGSKGSQFRTATSKQDANTQWVRPAKTKDFSDEMASINRDLTSTMDNIINDIIRSYVEGF